MPDGNAASLWGDRLAIGAAVLCIVHCLALPVALALLPALASVLEIPETFHLGMLLFAVPVSAVTLLRTVQHRYRTSLLLTGGAGLALMSAALPLPSAETALTVAGSMLVALTHVLNRSQKLGRSTSGGTFLRG
jgi:hypothetical protein